MYFTLIVGPPSEIARCYEVARRHAAWFDASLWTSQHSFAAGLSVALFECGPHSRFGTAIDNPIIDERTRDRAIARMLDADSPPPVSLFVDRSTRQVVALIPPATPQPLYVHTTSTSAVLSDDLRVIAAVAGGDIDPAGAFALLQYGLTPPPLTLFRRVRKLPAGSVVRIDACTRDVAVERIAPAAQPLPDAASLPNAQRWIEHALDRTLIAVPHGAELYFSGGVDSSLLAARLKTLGRTDVRFVHLSFGPDDQETAHAQRASTLLGFEIDRVTYRDTDTTAVAARIGRDYSFPFGDASVLPSNVLAHASIDRLSTPPAIIEGTGADGSFAVPCSYGDWRLLYALPRPLRALAGTCYRRLHLWQSDTLFARRCQTLRRSAHLALEQAALATNAFDGIAFDTPPATRSELQQSFEIYAQSLLPGGTGAARLGLLDVTLLCAGAMAPKTNEPLRAHGIAAIYPFLSPAVVYGAARLGDASKCRGGIAKAPLKGALARELPADLVNRQKIGFTPPYRRLFASPQMTDILRGVVLAPANPMLDFCRPAVVRRMVDEASRGRLNVSGCDFLWSLAFTSIWLSQIREPRSVPAAAGSLPSTPCAASPAS